MKFIHRHFFTIFTEYIDRESLKPLKPLLRQQKSIPISIAFIIALLSAT